MRGVESGDSFACSSGVAWEPVGLRSRFRPDLSAVVRRTKEEGPWKPSPGLLAWVDQRNTKSPVRAGETHPSIDSGYSVCQKEHYAVSGFHCPMSRPYSSSNPAW